MTASSSDPEKLPALTQIGNLGLILAVAIILIHGVASFMAYDIEGDDFARWFYTGALSLRMEGNCYTYSDPAAGLLRLPYPPLSAYLFLPAAWAPRDVATNVWRGANLLLTGVLAWQLLAVVFPKGRLSRGERLRAWLVVLALLMTYFHQFWGNAIGQLHNLVAISVLGTFLALRARRNVAAGAWLGAGIMLKVIPGAVVLALIPLGRWRTLVTAGLVCLVVSVITWNSTADFVFNRTSGYKDVTAPALPHYVSLTAMASRLFVPIDGLTPVVDSPHWRRVSLLVAGAIAGLTFLVLLRKKAPEDILFAMSICLAMLFVPLFGTYHLNLAFVVAAICYRVILDHAGPRREEAIGTARRPWVAGRWPLVGLVLALLLTAVPANPFGLLRDTAENASVSLEWTDSLWRFVTTEWGLLLFTPQTYGLILLAGTCAAVGLAISSPPWGINQIRTPFETRRAGWSDHNTG